LRSIECTSKLYSSVAEKEELTEHLIYAASIGYGKTREEVLTIVERHMEAKEDVSLQTAGVNHRWWQKCLKMNSIRSGDSTAAIRLDAVNEHK